MEPKPPLRAWAIVGLLWFAFALNYIDRQVAYSIFPALRRDLGFSPTQLGLVGAVFLWTYGASMLLTGVAADRLHRPRLIIASLLAWSIATAGAGFSGSPGAFLGWRAMIGTAEALYFPAAAGLIAALHAGGTRSTALAVHQSAQLAGIVAGGWFGGWAADHIGWRTGFFAIAGLSLAYALLLAGIFARLQDRHDGAAVHRPDLRDLWRSRCYLTLAITFFSFCAMLWMLYAWLPNQLYERHGLPMARSGLVATAYLQLSSAAGLLLGGRLADRLVRRRRAARFEVAIVGVLVCPCFAWLVFTALALNTVKLSCVLFGITAGLLQANVFAAAYDIIPMRSYGIATGVLNVTGALGGGLSVLLAGVFKSSGGVELLAGSAAAATALTGIVLLTVVALRFGKEATLQQNGCPG